MIASLEPRVQDYGLSVLSAEATHLRICLDEPTTYALATGTNALGYKDFGAGNVFGAPEDAVPNGRKVVSQAVEDGTVERDGVASWFAVTDEINSRLLAHGSVSSAKDVVAGHLWTLGAISIREPSQ
jgi:hypothetical protein